MWQAVGVLFMGSDVAAAAQGRTGGIGIECICDLISCLTMKINGFMDLLNMCLFNL